MATTKSRRRPPTRTRSSRPTGKAGAKKTVKKPSALREAARTQLHGHGADAVALCFVALGALSGLALATDLAGPLGHALSSGITALLGNGAFLVPLALFAFAGLLLWRRSEDEAAAPIRIGIGVVLIVLSVAGLGHVVGGSPQLSDPVLELRNAGGYVGAGIGVPLVAGVGPAGAAIILLAFLVLGGLLASGTFVAPRGRARRHRADQAPRRFHPCVQGADRDSRLDRGRASQSPRPPPPRPGARPSKRSRWKCPTRNQSPKKRSSRSS